MWIILLAAVLSGNVFGAGCRDHNPKDKSVPLCPANGSSLLPDSYPVMAVSVSDQFGGGEFAADFVTKALQGAGDKPPQFFLNVNEGSLGKIRAAVIRAAANPKQRDKWLATLTRVGGSSYNWQQDFMQSYAGPDGRPVPRELAHYRGRGDHYTNLAQALQGKCGLKSGDPIFPDPNKDIDGYSGGNIEGGPNGLCIFGRDKLSEGEHKAHVQKVCGNGSPVNAPTQDMRVGHSDEVTATLRTGPGECDQVMLVASPRAALEAMRADPSGRAFAFLDSRDGEKLGASGSLFGICQKFLEGAPSSPSPSPNQPPAAVPERNGWFNVLFADRAYAGIKPLHPPGESVGETLGRCRDMTNGQFIQAFDQTSDLPALNRIMDERMAQFRKEAEAAWKKNAPGCPQNFIEMPTLYEGRTFNKGTEISRMISLMPNVNNVQQFGKSVLIPDPQNEALRKDIRARLKKAGLKADFINTNAQHSKEGNLHCTTNTLRYCRPRAGGK